MFRPVFVFFVFFIFTISSCSRDRKLTNILVGKWEISSMKVNDKDAFSSEYEGVTYQFDRCEEGCRGRLIIEDTDKGKIRQEFLYEVKDKGRTLSIIYTFSGINEKFDYIILEQSKTKITLSSIERGKIIVQEWRFSGRRII